jgi:hypothetical protein
MANGSNQAPDYGAKDLGKYEDLGRGPVTSYFRRVVGCHLLPFACPAAAAVVARQKLALFEFTSTSVAEARSSLWQEQDFSSRDHCVDLLTFSASTHSFGAISAKGE